MNGKVIALRQKPDVRDVRSRSRDTALRILIPRLLHAVYERGQLNQVAASGIDQAAVSLSFDGYNVLVSNDKVFGEFCILVDIWNSDGKIFSAEIGNIPRKYMDRRVSVRSWKRGDWEIELIAMLGPGERRIEDAFLKLCRAEPADRKALEQGSVDAPANQCAPNDANCGSSHRSEMRGAPNGGTTIDNGVVRLPTPLADEDVRSRSRDTALRVLVPKLLGGVYQRGQHDGSAVGRSRAVARFGDFTVCVWIYVSRAEEIAVIDVYIDGLNKVFSAEVGSLPRPYVDGQVSLRSWRRGDWELDLVKLIGPTKRPVRDVFRQLTVRG